MPFPIIKVSNSIKNFKKSIINVRPCGSECLIILDLVINGVHLVINGFDGVQQ
jgi:hypothetical protein